MANIGMFIGALISVYLIPGPDMVLVLQTSGTQGRWHAVSLHKSVPARLRELHAIWNNILQKSFAQCCNFPGQVA